MVGGTGVGSLNECETPPYITVKLIDELNLLNLVLFVMRVILCFCNTNSMFEVVKLSCDS